MEMVHPPYSNFYNSYGNFNHQNDKSPFHHSNNYTNNRLFKTNNKNLDSNQFTFPNIIKNNFNKKHHDNDLDRNNDSIEFKPGMADVPGWLKSLRLHKYKLIFSELSYEEMLTLTEQKLEEKNVTKGARHKIIVNIDKLRARQSNIISMEKTVDHEGISGLRQCLNELKIILITPIKAFESERECRDINNDDVAEGDLPSQIMKLLEKIFSCLQIESMRDEEVIGLYLSCCDKVLSHEAFTAFHKQSLIKIKSKLEPLRYSIQQQMKNSLDNKLNKMKCNNQWNVNNLSTPMPLNHVQNLNNFKSSNSSLNGYNGFNNNNNNNNNNSSNNNNNSSSNQYSSNGSLNNPQNYHPYQNNSKFNSNNIVNGNYNPMNSMKNNNSQQQNFYSKNCLNNKPQLVSSNHLNNFNNFNNSKIVNYNKLNESHKFNVNAESFNTSKQKTLSEINNVPSNGQKTFNERKFSGNRFMLGGNELNKFAEVFDEFDRQSNLNSRIETNNSTKIIAPLSSCSLFNACSQIGKFNKFNSQISSFDKLNSLDSSCLKPSNQYIFNNLFNDSTLMKCLENNSSLVNSNVFSHEKSETNYETDDYDDKDLLDENHQIYNHIELLSLRMTEQALGSSEFS